MTIIPLFFSDSIQKRKEKKRKVREWLFFFFSCSILSSDPLSPLQLSQHDCNHPMIISISSQYHLSLIPFRKKKKKEKKRRGKEKKKKKKKSPQNHLTFLLMITITPHTHTHTRMMSTLSQELAHSRDDTVVVRFIADQCESSRLLNELGPNLAQVFTGEAQRGQAGFNQRPRG